MTVVSLKTSTHLDARLRRIATARGLSRSAIIREAAERYVEETATHRDSCLTLASELIGLVSGPPDLSSNRERMKGFGA